MVDALPDSIDAVITAQIDRLPDHAAQAAAVRVGARPHLPGRRARAAGLGRAPDARRGHLAQPRQLPRLRRQRRRAVPARNAARHRLRGAAVPPASRAPRPGRRRHRTREWRPPGDGGRAPLTALLPRAAVSPRRGGSRASPAPGRRTSTRTSKPRSSSNARWRHRAASRISTRARSPRSGRRSVTFANAPVSSTGRSARTATPGRCAPATRPAKRGCSSRRRGSPSRTAASPTRCASCGAATSGSTSSPPEQVAGVRASLTAFYAAVRAGQGRFREAVAAGLEAINEAAASANLEAEAHAELHPRLGVLLARPPRAGRALGAGARDLRSARQLRPAGRRPEQPRRVRVLRGSVGRRDRRSTSRAGTSGCGPATRSRRRSSPATSARC